LKGNVLKTSGTNQSFQFVGIGQPKWRAHDSCRRLTNVSLQCFRQRGKAWTFVDIAPHHQCESSIGTKNSTHFAEGRGSIGEELQAQLAINDVE
jgi:hypothetical protein